MKPHTYHSSVLAHNPHTTSCRLETTPRPLTIPTTVLALSKWVLLSCSGMDDNIFNSWMGNYRFEVLAVPNRHHYPIVILLPVSGGDSTPASGSEGGNFPIHFTSLYTLRSLVTQSHASLHALSRTHLPQDRLLYLLVTLLLSLG